MRSIRCHPKWVRVLFDWRHVINGGVSFLVFAVLFYALRPIAGSFGAWMLSTGAVFVLYFFALVQRKVDIVCPHCTKIIETNTPWTCGYKSCGHANLNTDEFPFINRCEACKARPKAYRCHYEECRKFIFLTEDEQKINFAECLNFPTEADASEEEHKERVDKAKKAVELKKQQVEKAELDAKLKGFRKSDVPRKKNIEDHYRDVVKDEDDELRLRKKIDDEFKDDDRERERRHAALDKAVKEKGPW